MSDTIPAAEATTLTPIQEAVQEARKRRAAGENTGAILRSFRSAFPDIPARVLRREVLAAL